MQNALLAQIESSPDFLFLHKKIYSIIGAKHAQESFERKFHEVRVTNVGFLATFESRKLIRETLTKEVNTFRHWKCNPYWLEYNKRQLRVWTQFDSRLAVGEIAKLRTYLIELEEMLEVYYVAHKQDVKSAKKTLRSYRVYLDRCEDYVCNKSVKNKLRLIHR